MAAAHFEQGEHVAVFMADRPEFLSHGPVQHASVARWSPSTLR